MPAPEPPPTSSGFLALRTPLLPFEEFLRWTAADSKDALRARLREIVARPEVREALFVASPSLEESLAHWVRDPDGDRGRKVERTLVKYFVRMTSRATPFGLFSGCAVGTLGTETRLSVAERPRVRRHTRLDMDYLFALTEELGRDPKIRMTLRYRPNSSLYRAGGRLRYVEARLRDKTRSHHLVAVESTDYLEATLARARDGAAVADLAAALASPEISASEAEEYVHELISSQILVSDLAPAVTGSEPIHGLIAQLRGRAPIVAETLDAVRVELEALDAAGLGAAPDRYREIAKRLEALPPKVELSRLFQVDLVKPAGAAIGPEILRGIVDGISLLHRLAPPPGEDAFSRFRQKFRERYEAREVPLTEVLDDEIGIGFGDPTGAASPLLDGLAFPGERERTASWPARYRYLFRKLCEALQKGTQEIQLAEDDLKALESKERPPLPDALEVMATVVGPSRLWIHYVGGPSGARLLGRFCHGDPELHRHVEAQLRTEEALRPDAIFAEIVHLPEGRIGNILCRPALRKYEIPYLGSSGVAAEFQIPITDLRVRVEGDRIILRSERLGREVVPRLTSAHNYGARSISLYRFLCGLQSQGVAGGLGWSWGPLEGSPFLPRVSVGCLVLSRATWTLTEAEIKNLPKSDLPAWRRERGLPRFVAVADADNELLIDFDNVLCVETFLDLMKGRTRAELVEFLPGPDALAASGPEGHYVHEIVVPFVRTRQPSPAAPPPTASAAPRSFRPGSEWLYLKFYCGDATADRVLREVVAPIVRSGAADRWFFIRYGDPDWHLRVRLHGAPERLLPIVSSLPPSPIWRLQVDTYEREVERYGGDVGIELSERLFHADSDAVLEIVETLSGDEGSDARWRLTLRGMDDLLDDLGFDLQGRSAILRRCRESFGREFRVDGSSDGQLGEKFRKERKALEALLDRSKDEGSDFEPGFAAFRRRSERVRPIAAELRAAGAPLAELAGSYLHMHANRLLRSAQRQHELVLYDFLVRLYESRQARQGR